MYTHCDRCNTKLAIDDSFEGRDIRCPTCEAVFSAVPSSGEKRTEEIVDEDNSEVTPITPGEESAVTNAAPNTEWYLAIPEGHEFGPVSKDVLDTWVGEGRISTACRIRNGEADWLPAESVYAELSKDGNPFASAAIAAGRRLDPHRGSFILSLAIAGCIIPFLSVWPAVLGTRDLRLMSAGRMDPSGDAMTRSGQAIAMVSSMIWIGSLAIALLALMVQILRSLQV